MCRPQFKTRVQAANCSFSWPRDSRFGEKQYMEYWNSFQKKLYVFSFLFIKTYQFLTIRMLFFFYDKLFTEITCYCTQLYTLVRESNYFGRNVIGFVISYRHYDNNNSFQTDIKMKNVPIPFRFAQDRARTHSFFFHITMFNFF